MRTLTPSAFPPMQFLADEVTSMNRIATAALVILALAALAPAVAQSPLPNASPGASAIAPSDQTTEATTATVRSNRDAVADARICLELPTNLQIIKCAEKYLPHKRKK